MFTDGRGGGGGGRFLGAAIGVVGCFLGATVGVSGFANDGNRFDRTDGPGSSGGLDTPANVFVVWVKASFIP